MIGGLRKSINGYISLHFNELTNRILSVPVCTFFFFLNSTPVRAEFFLLTSMSELPVVQQSCRRTAELSWSRRRSSAARAHLWSVRVTVVTPPSTSAGIATPACPWWTLVLLWRYQAEFLLSSAVCLHISHLFCLSSPVAVVSSLIFLSSVLALCVLFLALVPSSLPLPHCLHTIFHLPPVSVHADIT